MVIRDRSERIRVVTYNIHKCRGLDRRVRPERIAEILRELDADIIALQEVLGPRPNWPEEDHANFIAAELVFPFVFGENRKHQGHAYGNALLSRFPLRAAQNYDITVQGREPRGCLRVDIDLPGGSSLHVFNVHLGLAIRERRQQVQKLLSPEILHGKELTGPRIVLGDFNEWTRGLTTRLLRSQFTGPDLRAYPHRSRTYPGVLPFLHLDYIYFERSLNLRCLAIHRTRRSLVASDHLPLVADLSLTPIGQLEASAA